MKKTHSFDELSDRVCLELGCPKRIKQRLVESKDARHCFEHEPKHRISGHSKRSRLKADEKNRKFLGLTP